MRLSALLLLAVLTLCSIPASGHTSIDSVPERDRVAILGMAGAFRVTFRFEETLGVSPGYQTTDPYEESAYELVEVIEDRGDFISLQHVLVVERADGSLAPVKHWRQDWTFEDTDVLAYRRGSIWEREDRDLEGVRGTWTQAVFQTTDGPRYEAVGRWSHIGDRSSWESELTRRPLPRRERTKRDDYDVLVCRNRHTVTPLGWVHEQDNQKVVLDGSGEPSAVIAHEMGVNTYERVDDALVTVAEAYWRDHAAAWAAIREAWTGVLSRPRVELTRDETLEPLHEIVYAAVEDAAERARLAERLAAYAR